jgi:hypothetical protein
MASQPSGRVRVYRKGEAPTWTGDVVEDNDDAIFGGKKRVSKKIRQIVKPQIIVTQPPKLAAKQQQHEEDLEAEDPHTRFNHSRFVKVEIEHVDPPDDVEGEDEDEDDIIAQRRATLRARTAQQHSDDDDDDNGQHDDEILKKAKLLETVSLRRTPNPGSLTGVAMVSDNEEVESENEDGEVFSEDLETDLHIQGSKRDT